MFVSIMFSPVKQRDVSNSFGKVKSRETSRVVINVAKVYDLCTGAAGLS